MDILIKIGGSIVLLLVYTGQILYLIYCELIALLANLYQCWFRNESFSKTKLLIAVKFPDKDTLIILGVIFFFLLSLLVGYINTRRLQRLRKEKYLQQREQRANNLKINKSEYQLNMYSVKHKYKTMYQKRKKLIMACKNSKFINYAMTDDEFEYYVAYLFFTNGFNPVTVTSHNNDYGLDIITAFKKKTYGIQCKHYMPQNWVNNNAIQAASAGAISYGLKQAVVVTSSNFTQAAIKQARSGGVILIDGKTLQEIELNPKILLKYLNNHQLNWYQKIFLKIKNAIKPIDKREY